jgi:hypothetical protein
VLLQTKPRGGAGVADVGLLSIITTKVWFGLLLCLALLFGCVFLMAVCRRCCFFCFFLIKVSCDDDYLL